MVRTVLLSLALLLAAGPLEAEPYKGFPRGDALISAAALNALLDGPGPKPVVLAAVGRVPWLLGHIPGAQRVQRRAYTDRNGMAVDRERFQAFARILGIDDRTPVVVYDNTYDAARLWWLFRLYGKTDVRVLDGGWRAWDEAGYTVERGPGRAAPKAGTFTAAPALAGWTANMAEAAEARPEEGTHLWDARDIPEWEGTGPIGEARFIGWRAFRRTDEGRPAEFRTAAEIDAILRKAGFEPDRDHIFYCHSGVRAATPMLALYLMGYPVERLRLYDGSWMEWSRRASRG